MDGTFEHRGDSSTRCDYDNVTTTKTVMRIFSRTVLCDLVAASGPDQSVKCFDGAKPVFERGGKLWGYDDDGDDDDNLNERRREHLGST